MRAHKLLAACTFALLTPACDDATSVDAAPGAEDEGPDTISFDSFKADAPPSPTTVVATALGNSTGQGPILELVVTDVWGRLPDRQSQVTLVREADGKKVTLQGYLQPILVRLSQPGRYRLEAEIPDHLKEKMTFEVKSGGIAQPADQVTHWSWSVDPRTVAGKSEAVHSLYIGLPHAIFAASGPPARRGNEISVLDNGRDAFDAMAGDLDAMRSSFHLSLWLMRYDFELRRSPDWRTSSDAARKWQTIEQYLRRLPGTRRLLLAEFNGREDLINGAILDDEIQIFGERTGDGVELMLQANETEVPYRGEVAVNAGGWSYRARLLDKYPEWKGRHFTNQERFKVGKYDRNVSWTDLQVASYHQKFAVIDDAIGYLGGMNMNYADWDRPELSVFDPQRVEPGTDADDRTEVELGLEQGGINPRKDYMTRVEGPLVHDLQVLFHKRWEQGLREGAAYAGKSTRYALSKAVDVTDPNDEGVQAQLTVTMPMPFWEHSILEATQKAIATADDYIYIEDQYFRAPLINAMIVDRMAVDPDLKLIVVTKDVPYKDPGRKWTALSLKEFNQRYPERVVFLTLRASDIRPQGDDYVATFADVDIHSKMLIVDDEIMSVGSCNKNNRGFIYEGEANLHIWDPFLVSEVRRHEWARLVGPEYAEQTEDPEVAFEVFRNLAEFNDAVHDFWEGQDGELPAARMMDSMRPQGLVYPLVVPEEWFFNPGPDFY